METQLIKAFTNLDSENDNHIARLELQYALEDMVTSDNRITELIEAVKTGRSTDISKALIDKEAYDSLVAEWVAKGS